MKAQFTRHAFRSRTAFPDHRRLNPARESKLFLDARPQSG